jgi:uncharacterized phiE125 gp8 family phage protein
MVTAIVTLAEAKAHLRYPTSNTSDDAALAGFIDAASDVIDTECNIVVPQQFEESYDGGSTELWLYHFPIISVELVRESWGMTSYDLTQVDSSASAMAGNFSYSIDEPETGQLLRRSAGNVNIPFQAGKGNIKVVYVAGRNSVPGTVRLAALELIAHWWQGSQQRSGSGSLPRAYDGVNTDFSRALAITPVNAGVPYRIIEMLKPFRRLPVMG